MAEFRETVILNRYKKYKYVYEKNYCHYYNSGAYSGICPGGAAYIFFLSKGGGGGSAPTL